jgi:hypothetical protein
MAGTRGGRGKSTEQARSLAMEGVVATKVPGGQVW